MIVYLDSRKPSNAPITKMPRSLALAVHAFTELSPAMWCFLNLLPLLYLVAWVV
jgi:hypothetical protein